MQVSRFKRADRLNGEDEPAAVGMSLLLEKLVYAVWQEKEQTSLVSLVRVFSLIYSSLFI